MATIFVVPATTGPGVPVAAIRTAADGSTHVLRPDGQQVPITVLASGDGLAVVDGLTVGEQVLVIGGTGSGGGVPVAVPASDPVPDNGSEGVGDVGDDNYSD